MNPDATGFSKLLLIADKITTLLATFVSEPGKSAKPSHHTLSQTSHVQWHHGETITQRIKPLSIYKESGHDPSFISMYI